jgi:hypothetical protein
MIRRIGLVAGPGAGKSTTAAWLFSQLKLFVNDKDVNIKVELVQEYVKELAWRGHKIRPWDQWDILSQQLMREYNLLHNGVDILVTDSPITMYPFYGRRANCPANEAIPLVVNEFNYEFPILHIFLHRDDKSYFQHGRYETLSQAREADEGIRKVLAEMGIPFKEFSFRDQSAILQYVLENAVEPRLFR